MKVRVRVSYCTDLEVPDKRDADEFVNEWFDSLPVEEELHLDDVEELYRVCSRCGERIEQGYTVDGGGWYSCEGCFEEHMDETYGKGKWRENPHSGEAWWEDGYFDFEESGKWIDTGIYWTEWWY